MNRITYLISFGLLLCASIALLLWCGATRSHAAASSPIVETRAARTSQFAPPSVLPAHSPVAAGDPDRPWGPRVAASWGSGPGELGRSRPAEGNPEAPMSFAVANDGHLLALDQVNHRIALFNKAGVFERSLPVVQRVPQDIAIAPNGTIATLDRLGDKNVAVMSSDGRLVGKLSLEGRGVPESGGVTGVFVDGSEVYVEYAHARLVRVGNTDGSVADDRNGIPGRPSRDGSLILSAGIADAKLGRVWVSAADRSTMNHRFTREVRLLDALRNVVLLDSDRKGLIYLGAIVGGSRPNPSAMLQIACLDSAQGNLMGGALVEIPQMPEETFRSMVVMDEGGVVIAVPSESGMQYWNYGCS